MVLAYFQYSITVLEFAQVVFAQVVFDYPVLDCLVFEFTMLDFTMFNYSIPDYPILLTWKVEHQRVLIHQSLLDQLLNHRNSLIYFSKNY